MTAGVTQVIAAARPTRRQITIKNDGATTDMIAVNCGAAATSSHFQLAAGQSAVFVAADAWHMVAVTGTPAVSVMDEYD